MIVKTSELTGAALDWAVAKCEIRDVTIIGSCVLLWIGKDSNIDYEPSTNWAQGGPIIERERMNLQFVGGQYEADTSADCFGVGSTPLIAAMRCFIAGKLGDEVEIPNQLTEA